MILSIIVESPSAQDEPARRMGPRPAGRPPHAGGPGRSTVVWQKTASGGENSPKSERLRCERPSFVRKAPGRRFCGNDGEGARAARPSDFGGFSPRGRALCETGVDTNRCLPNLEPSLPWSGAGQGPPRLTGGVLPGEPAWPTSTLVQQRGCAPLDKTAPDPHPRTRMVKNASRPPGATRGLPARPFAKAPNRADFGRGHVDRGLFCP